MLHFNDPDQLELRAVLPKFCANGQKAGVIGRVVVVEQGRQ